MGWASLQEDVQKIREHLEHLASKEARGLDGSDRALPFKAIENECRRLIGRLEQLSDLKDISRGDLLLNVAALRRENETLKAESALTAQNASSDYRGAELLARIDYLERINGALRQTNSILGTSNSLLKQEIKAKNASIRRLRLGSPVPVSKRRERR